MRLIILMCMIALATATLGCSGNGAQQLFDTAKLEELQDNRDHARQLYQQVIDEYPGTECAKKAKERLAELKEN